MARKDKIKYYDISKILSIDACYYIIYGTRSNGKTYGALNYCLEEYFKDGSEFAYIRRWDDDIKGIRGATLFNSHINNGVIKRLSKGRYDDVTYKGRCFYLVHHDDEGNAIINDKPFAYAFALTMGEHYKSNSYPRIRNIVFDEFLTRGAYIDDEFVKFQNVLSTLIRLRDDVKIFMLGNTVNKYSPYIREMGLTKMDKQQPGTIDLYTYGETSLRVAVEYSDMPIKDKKSNKYFAFDNPRLNMIKTGAWEIDIYPHYPSDYIKPLPKDILYQFFVVFEGSILTCQIIDKEAYEKKNDETGKVDKFPRVRFIFVYPKTTPIRADDTSLVYCIDACVKPNYRRKITKPTSKIERYITSLFIKGKVFYADNETGEIMRNYLLACK